MGKTLKALVALVLVVGISYIGINAIKLDKEYTDYRNRTIVKKNTKTNINNKTITVNPKSKYNLDFLIGNKNSKATFKSSNTKLATVNKKSGQVQFKNRTGNVTIHITSFENKKYKVKFIIGETYAKVNIQKQKAYLYVRGKLKRTASVVTGKKGVHDTPKGTYKIAYKTRNTYLDGATVGFDYYLPVKYWIPIANTGGVGFHDASWRKAGTFGGNYYKVNGSHGCINMKTADVAYFYKYLKSGTRIEIV